MKHLPAILLTGFLFSSCNDAADTGATGDTLVPAQSKLSLADSLPIKQYCFGISSTTDTVEVTLYVDSSQVSGSMYTHYAGKDINSGTLSGILKSDTIIADYKFRSEGVASIRQVAFLVKGNQLVEGFGPVIEKNGRMFFSDPASLTFNASPVLGLQACR